MSYSDAESKILTTIRLLSDWKSTNTARVKWTQLNSGKSDRYCILRPGESFESEVISIGHITQVRTHSTLIEVWIRFKESSTPVTLQGLVDGLITHLQKYPYLGAGAGTSYTMSNVKGGGDMEERWVVSNGPKWAYWEVVLEWQEETRVTPAE